MAIYIFRRTSEVNNRRILKERNGTAWNGLISLRAGMWLALVNTKDSGRVFLES